MDFIEELVQKDYVIREPSKSDRRSVVLTLTDIGASHFNKIEADMYEKFKRVFSNIAKDKKDMVLEALQIFNEACRKTEENCCDQGNV